MDIKILFEDEFKDYGASGEILFEENDAALDYGLTNLVLASLFTDKRAFPDDEIPDGTTKRRGWWGDTVSDTEDDTIGSRLWLLSRSKTTNDVLNKAKGFIDEALEWMVEDGLVAEIEVTTERIFYASDGNYTLGAQIDLRRESGENISINFKDLWDGQFDIAS